MDETPVIETVRGIRQIRNEGLGGVPKVEVILAHDYEWFN